MNSRGNVAVDAAKRSARTPLADLNGKAVSSNVTDDGDHSSGKPLFKIGTDAYHAVRRIEAGALASVLLVKRDRDGLHMAVKRIRIGDEDHRRRARRELEIHLDMKHDCIVRALSGIEKGNNILFIMPWAPFGDLSDVASRAPGGRIGVAKTVESVCQIADALLHVHAAGFAHLDVKLENVFVFAQNPDMVVKLGDFGCAQPVGEHPVSLVGTYAYMAPEILLCCEEQDLCKADVWSLGVMALTLMQGELPWTAPAVTDERFVGFIDGGLGTAVTSDVLASDFFQSVLCVELGGRASMRILRDHVWLKS